MIGLTPTLASITVLIAGLAAMAAEPPALPPSTAPINDYEAHERHGFKVKLCTWLADRGPILRCIDERLADIVRVMPPVHLSLLRDVTVWVSSEQDGKLPASVVENAAAFYVPLDTNPLAHGLPAETKGGVVVVADRFLGGRVERWAADSAPGWLLHEMAHALHDRILGYHDSAVQTAYRQAVDRKLYDAVDTRAFVDLGRVRIDRRPAYARTNHLEYFAELSTAYLNRSTVHYPFTRDNLADHDPGGYVLMDTFWRPVKFSVVNEFPFPVAIDRFAESGRRFRLFDLMPGKEKAFDGWEGMSLVATNTLDRTKHWVEKPDRNGKTWRLNPDATTSGDAAYVRFLFSR